MVCSWPPSAHPTASEGSRLLSALGSRPDASGGPPWPSGKRPHTVPAHCIRSFYAGERLSCWDVVDRRRHLARSRAAHLSLDTPGYNQGTSGLDALWATLPLLSLPLERWCGRMGLALLRGTALPSGVVASLRELEDTALRLGRGHEPLSHREAAAASQEAAAAPHDAAPHAASSSLDLTRGRRRGLRTPRRPAPVQIEVAPPA